jgi:hypothetical protein
MRRLNTSTFLFAALLLSRPALADSPSDKPAEVPSQSVASQAPDEPASGGLRDEPSETDSQSSPPLSRDEICQIIEAAASGEALPFEFLARLIYQESRFNPRAVSPAGAQGIAQFMPKTANGRGLADPFEPVAALHESAEFLRELLDQFGNLGLAAAAYNAGPKRVQDWLAKRTELPRETQDYVHIITGHRPEKWVASEPPSVETAAVKAFQCDEIAKLAAKRHRAAVIERLASLVAQRLTQQRRGEASATEARSQPRSETPKLAARPQGSARSGILGKRVAPPPGPTRVEQVAKLVARPGKQPRFERIIRITAQSRNQPRIETVANGTRRPPKLSSAEKVAKVAEPRGNLKGAKPSRDKAAPGTQLAGKLAKTKAVAASPQKKTAALARDRQPTNVSSAKRAAPSSKVRVAANTRMSAEKSCSQAKGARKPCRAT